jgi:hypothetical protein
MARVTGLEPATSGVTGRRSNQLSYTRVLNPREGAELGQAVPPVKHAVPSRKQGSYRAKAKVERSLRLPFVSARDHPNGATAS